MPGQTRIASRRQVLGAMGGIAAALLSSPRVLAARSTPPLAPVGPQRPRTSASAIAAPHHLAWVWQFRHDGDPAEIRDTLAAHGLGVVLKTHDGTRWMSRYDPTPHAVAGPASVERYASFFEQAGVPFHAWTVVKGVDIEREVQMAADVLGAGARSLFLDLEAHAGFWQGTQTTAERYGEALRRLQPGARLSTSIDPRPWEIERIPLREFAAFTDEIAPQVYWQMFASPGNVRLYRRSGHEVGSTGVTAGLVLAAAAQRLGSYGLPIHPIGDGTVTPDRGWSEFIDESYGAEAETVSVWRYGVADPGIWRLLRDTPPRVASYVVQPGDSLGALAAQWNTSVAAIVEANGIADPNVIGVGVRLRIPTGARPPAGAAVPASTSSAEPQLHVVEPGETLSGIALRYGTTVDAIRSANGIANAHMVRIGQRLTVPAAGSPAGAPSPPAPREHVVARGETLTSIARRYGTTVTALVRENGLANANLVRVGQRLVLP